MTNALRNSDLSAIWQIGGSVASEPHHTQLPAAGTTLCLNVSHLPAPDQSRIWTFLEFIHEYSSTAWRLQSGNDADIWFVDGSQAFVPPTGARTTPVVVHVVRDARHASATDDNYLVRPLEMDAFAALLQRLEKSVLRADDGAPFAVSSPGIHKPA